MISESPYWEFAVGECSYCHRPWVKAAIIDDVELIHICMSDYCSGHDEPEPWTELNLTFALPLSEYVCLTDHNELNPRHYED